MFMIASELIKSQRMFEKTIDRITLIINAMIDIGRNIGWLGIKKARTIAPRPEAIIKNGIELMKIFAVTDPLSKIACSIWDGFIIVSYLFLNSV